MRLGNQTPRLRTACKAITHRDGHKKSKEFYRPRISMPIQPLPHVQGEGVMMSPVSYVRRECFWDSGSAGAQLQHFY